MAKTQDKAIQITMPNIQRAMFTLVGTTPLMVNRKSEAALASIKASEPGKKINTKVKPTLTEDEKYLASRYMIDPKTHGFPAAAVKQAMISAIRALRESGNTHLSMTAAKAMFTTSPSGHASLMRLRYKSVEHDETWGNLPTAARTPVPIHRAVYTDWECECVIQFDADLIPPEAITHLLMKAGQVGIGAWRPEKNGNFGTFEIKASKTKR